MEACRSCISKEYVQKKILVCFYLMATFFFNKRDRYLVEIQSFYKKWLHNSVPSLQVIFLSKMSTHKLRMLASEILMFTCTIIKLICKMFASRSNLL